MYDLVQSRTHKFAMSTEDTVLKSKFNLCSDIKPNLGVELWTVLTNLLENPCWSNKKRESFGETRCKKQDQFWNRHQQVLGILLLWSKDNGSTLKRRNPRILIVFKCQNSLLDCFDTVNKLIEKKMQESITTKLSMNAGKSYQTLQDIGQTKWRSNSPLLRIGHLTNGNEFWQKVEHRRKGSIIAWTRTILRNSCTFEQSKDMQEVQSILHCKTTYYY